MTLAERVAALERVLRGPRQALWEPGIGAWLKYSARRPTHGPMQSSPLETDTASQDRVLSSGGSRDFAGQALDEAAT